MNNENTGLGKLLSALPILQNKLELMVSRNFRIASRFFVLNYCYIPLPIPSLCQNNIDTEILSNQKHYKMGKYGGVGRK